jgi:hypothetical protein
LTALRNVLLVAGAVLLAALAAELSLRLVYRDKFGQRPGFFVADQDLGWKPAAGLDHTFYGPDFTMAVRTDSEGHRLGALGEVDFGKRLIVLLGDSNVFGWGVSTGETCASFLDEWVSEASGGAARVVNLGVGGYGTWQSSGALARFFEAHADADPIVLLVFHSPNDPIDNVNSIGYQTGDWEVVDRQPKSRSAFHLVNFFNYAIAAARLSRARSKADDVNPFLQDVAFAFGDKLPRELPPTVVLNGRTVDLSGMSSEDYSKEATWRRATLTPIQRALTREGVRSIQLQASAHGVPVLHVIIPSAHDWFTAEMTTLLEDATTGTGAVFVGRFPDISEWGGPYLNDHSGGHYTPEFNRWWADHLARALQERHLLD